MRPYCTTLLALGILSGCGAKDMNALEMRPLAASSLEQISGIELPLEIKQHILTYCEKQPTDVLPARRAKLTEATFVHPVYEELGGKTVSYWASGDSRYVSCANSDEQFVRTFEVEPLAVLESARVGAAETEARRAMTFESESDVSYINELFHIDPIHESVIPGSMFRYETPESGSLYVTYEVKRNGRTMDRMIEPGLFVFNGERTSGHSFLTRLADGRVSLQIGTDVQLERKVLPDIFSGEYVQLDSSEEMIVLDGSKRQLMKRVIVSDDPITDVGDESSLTLSERYGTVIEVWGNVRLPLTTTLMMPSPAGDQIRLATYERDGVTGHLDGPNTQALFALLADVEAGKRPREAIYHGTITLYERLSEQTLDVYVTPDNTDVWIVDLDSGREHVLDAEQLSQLVGI
ncbi:hypothetical protein [Exiguobacterium sp.]|uniref:hypothetical protein n=1 Tax=Exiguobacterium sp. TaxID=44751 RepID=UPI00391D7891